MPRLRLAAAALLLGAAARASAPGRPTCRVKGKVLSAAKGSAELSLSSKTGDCAFLPGRRVKVTVSAGELSKGESFAAGLACAVAVGPRGDVPYAQWDPFELIAADGSRTKGPATVQSGVKRCR